MKLKQKSYLVSVLLVTGVLMICVLFLVIPNLNASIKAIETRAIGEEKALAQAMDRLLLQTRPDDRKKNAQVFSVYETENAAFSVGKGTAVWTEATPPIPDIGMGQAAWTRQNGRTVLIVNDTLSNDIWLRYRLDATEEMRRIEWQAFGSVLIGILLCSGIAAALYAMLLRINRPIDRLAHELRTPLTVIRGYGELIERAKLTPEQQQSAASYIVTESERLGAISRKLLTMSDAREQAYHPERIDLHALAAHLRQAHPTLAIEITWDTITADRALLLSMLSNLIGNAVKASAANSPVTLFAAPGVIEVRDHGKGMTKEQLHYVNDPAHAKNPSIRSGLGIPLCHEIAALHHATLHFTSVPGVGTTATIRFHAQKGKRERR